MSKQVILTGLRANNDLHIGNYFGALLPIIDLALERSEEYQVNLFMPDLHSFTTPIDFSSLKNNIMLNLKMFVAAGLPLDNEDVYIYRQSYIPAHSEMTWILDCFTGVGELERMTQYKDRSLKLSHDRISTGLFNYPVLMASDILLYGSSYVPVGDDQSQHIEFARDIAERMNAQFNQDLFVIPEPVDKQHKFFGADQGLRIKDLQDPTKKMSKSDDTGRGVIFLTEDAESARKKIMSAETDSLGKINYDQATQPGISNLLDLLTLLGGTKEDYIGQTKYGELKAEVADKLIEHLRDFKQKLDSVDEEKLTSKLEDSERKMSEVANRRLLSVHRAIGLR